MLKIAVLVSGNGSNLQAIIDSIEAGKLLCRIEAVICDRVNAYSEIRAKAHNLPYFVLDKTNEKRNTSNQVLEILKNKVDLIVLAGFLSILEGELLKEFKNKIINLHPSLLPKFGGKGFYGIKVHEKVLEAREVNTGCTVHFVDEKIDAGKFILQKFVPVLEGDTPKALQERVAVKEHEAIVEAISLFI